MEATTEREERRLERRYTVNLAATIQTTRDLPKIECRVIDISVSGAKIGAIGGEVPDNFVLCFDEKATVIRFCKVVWREGSAVGVQFVIQKKKEIESSPAASEQELKERIAAASRGAIYPL